MADLFALIRIELHSTVFLVSRYGLKMELPDRFGLDFRVFSGIAFLLFLKFLNIVCGCNFKNVFSKSYFLARRRQVRAGHFYLFGCFFRILRGSFRFVSPVVADTGS